MVQQAPAESVAKPAPKDRSSSAEIGNLDLLRSMAVAFVVARHLLYLLSDPSNALFHPQALGIFGVLIFFVHTSLVLMMSMDRHGQADRPPFGRGYASFMVRRVFRIYPLSVVVVLLAFFVLLPQGLYSNDFALTPGLLLSNLFLVQNLTGDHNVIAPLWSLPVEVQMYLFLPLLFLLVGRIGYRLLAFAAWPLCVLVALATYRFHWIPGIFGAFPFFVPGVIAFDAMRRRDERPLPWWTLPLATLGIGVVYMALVRRFGGQFVWGYPVCLALGFLIAHVRDIPPSLDWLHQGAKTVAKYSYGIYLFHDVWISLCFHHAPWLPGPLRLPAMLATTALSAYAGYHLVEAPLIRVGARLGKGIASIRKVAHQP